MTEYRLEFKHKLNHKDWIVHNQELSSLSEALELIRRKRYQYPEYEWRMVAEDGQLWGMK